jgi:DNA-binding LacI/PurR family transcriptional regulator
VPLVLVDSGDLPELASVTVEDEAGARAAAEHVAALGHHEILVIAMERSAATASTAGPSSPGPGGVARTARVEPSGVTERRLAGYRSALADAGIELPAAAVRVASATIEGGADAFRAAWRAGQRPTAVLAMSDGLAIGVITAATDLGRRVPEDLSVVGFDDIDVAARLDPPLTTVRQPVREKGVEAIRLIVEVLETSATRPAHTRLPARLVVRGSTGPGPWHDPTNG